MEISKLQNNLKALNLKTTEMLEIKRLELQYNYKEGSDSDDELPGDSWFDPDDDKSVVSSLLGKRSYLQLLKSDDLIKSEPEETFESSKMTTRLRI